MLFFFLKKVSFVCVEKVWIHVFSAAEMGNCHTVGPNEALVVSGNVNASWSMCV